MNAGLSAWLNTIDGGRVRFQDLENENLYFYPQGRLHIRPDYMFISSKSDKEVAGSRAVFFDAKKIQKAEQGRTSSCSQASAGLPLGFFGGSFKNRFLSALWGGGLWRRVPGGSEWRFGKDLRCRRACEASA